MQVEVAAFCGSPGAVRYVELEGAACPGCGSLTDSSGTCDCPTPGWTRENHEAWVGQMRTNWGNEAAVRFALCLMKASFEPWSDWLRGEPLARDRLIEDTASALHQLDAVVRHGAPMPSPPLGCTATHALTNAIAWLAGSTGQHLWHGCVREALAHASSMTPALTERREAHVRGRQLLSEFALDHRWEWIDRTGCGKPPLHALVIAGSASEARHFAHRAGWNDTDWTYVSGAAGLVGVSPFTHVMVTVGTWFRRDDARRAFERCRLLQIYEFARSRIQ